ncbi:MAG: vanadium-dependent haloperoxidase [Bacteroidetes bacterium]|nr:vanadium-dependent haloperoxidase [Bacteroidota bacterium]MDA1335372.1 vanadium-dependent haloperoxidase [Bacteroidota bacterium]
MKSIRLTLVLLSAMLALVGAETLNAQEKDAGFDAVKGNAAVQIIIPYVDPVFFEEVTVHGGDPSILIRYTTLIVNAWFDAAAAYHPTAVGVYSTPERQTPYDPSDNSALNVAMASASKAIVDQCFPNHRKEWKMMLDEVIGDRGDDPTIRQAVIIGKDAGKAVWKGRLNDGMNHSGTMGGHEAMPMPFADYTGYAPVNTPYAVNDPSRWQPAVERMGTGKYRAQMFVTPQYGLVTPYTELWSLDLPLPAPSKSNVKNLTEYTAQANEVLAKSAAMTDEQKMLAEFYENKLFSLPVSAVVASMIQGMDLMEFVHMFFAQEVAIFDAGIWIWAKKKEFDAVRPFTAIPYLHGDSLVSAWGGPGKGTVELPASNWTSYLPVADHPEYPSASACLCRAHATVLQQVTGTNDLFWEVPFAKGSSFVEPGITPAADFTFTFNTWDEFAEVCGLTRLWSGVHFEDSVNNIKVPCTKIGAAAAAYVDGLVAGGDGSGAEGKGKKRKK